MNEYEQAQRQNLKVWARRLNLEIADGHYAACKKFFPGSTLVGPLSIVISNVLRGEVPLGSERLLVANLAGNALAKIFRGESHEKDVLVALAAEAVTVEEKVLLAKYGLPTAEIMTRAITSRAEEKSRPNLPNAILGNIRGGRVFGM